MSRVLADLYSESNLVRENGIDLEIILPNEINTASIEFILKHCYNKSKKNTGKVFFNFKYAIWIDPFALNILAIWIRELQGGTSFLSLEVPASPVLKHYLHASGFYNYVNQKIDRVNEVSDSTVSISQYSPIQFFDNEKQFRDYLNYLKSEDVLRKVFYDLENDELVGRGKIRDIILNEIGDNIFTHAKSTLANVLMAKFKPKNESGRLAWSKRMVENAPPLEKRFFSDLPENVGVLIISIADNGLGISKTLKDSYAHDKKVFIKDVNEVDVLEYAFDKYSSSRSTSVRIAGVERLNVFTSEVDYKEIYKPTTGLYKLYSLVQKLKGLIYLRSNSSLITINFLSDNVIVEKSTSKVFKNNYPNRPTHFTGSQFKIVIPDFGNAAAKQSFSKLNFSFPESNTSFQRKHLALFQYTDIFQSSDQRSQVQALNKLVEDIRSSYNEKKIKGIVLDVGIEPDKLSEITKYLQYIIAVLVVSQDDKFSNVMVNVPESIEDILEESFNNKDGYEYHPLVYFNRNYERNILCVSDDENKDFKDLYRNSVLGRFDTSQQALFHKFRILFGRRKEDNKDVIFFVHNRRDIFSEVAKFYTDELAKFVNDPRNGVYRDKIRVLLPSKFYCEGFYEVANIISNPRARIWLKTWIECQMLVYKPAWVVSLSPNCNNLLDEILSPAGTGQFGRVKHVKIPEPLALDYVELIKASQEIGDSEDVVLFTDVIGTTKSIGNLIKTLSHKNIKEIFTIIDVSENNSQFIEVGQTAVAIQSIVKGNFMFHLTKPSNWHYHDLYFVDKKTNKLGQKSLKQNEPIWAGPSDTLPGRDYILNLLLRHKIVFRAKGESLDGVRVSSWFDLNRLISEFKDSFAQSILANLEAYVESENESVPIDNSLLLHTREKPDVDLVITSLIGNQKYKLVPNSISLEVFYFRYLEPPIKLNNKTLIFIDDVFTDSEPIFKLLDYCSRNDVYAIFIYYLIKIDNDIEFERIKNVKVYSSVKVFIEYLIDIQLPVYKNDAPFDEHRDDLEFTLFQIPKKPDFNSLRSYIERQIRGLEFLDVYQRIEQGEMIANDQIIRNCVFLQKCKSSLEDLSKLIDILGKIEMNEDEALNFIELLSDEFISEIDSSQNAKILGEELKTVVIKCLDYLIVKNRVPHISANRLYSILHLVSYYDVTLLFNYYDLIHEHIEFKEEKLNILTYFLLKLYAEFDMEKPVEIEQVVRLKEWLPKYSNRAHGSYLIEEINEALNYKREHSAIDVAKEIIKIRQEFHAINRARDLFGTVVSTGIYEAFNEVILDLSQKLLSIRRTLLAISTKNYRNPEFNSDLINDINKLDRFISTLDEISGEETKYADMSSELLMLSGQIDYYFNPNQNKNFPALIRSIVQDIGPVVRNRIHSFYHSMFIANDIQIVGVPTINQKFSIFAENDGLATILDNLLNNVLGHSKTKVFSYEIVLEDGFVVVRFFDNGIPIEAVLASAKKHRNKGLGIIDELLKLYDGDLLYKEEQREVGGIVFTNTTQIKFKFLDFD